LQHCQLTYKSSSISYYRFGTGAKTAVCFHGYGEDGTSYTFLEKYAGNDFTFFSIELPYHGQTVWNEGLDFTHGDLQTICNAILEQELGTAPRRISLLGFSLGGRIALSLYQAQPSSIEKIVLLAPDGLKVNFWYWLATQSGPGNDFFAFTMKKPSWFFGFLKGMNKIGLVNASVFKFTNYYIGDEEVRQLLYNRWTSLRKLRPNLGRIKKLILHNNTRVSLVYGQHDRIILSSVGEKFRKGIEQHCTLSVIPSGHQVLHEKHVKDILPLLLK
jgi:pimeloyl-ACP methyl ester carboxylesterase